MLKGKIVPLAVGGKNRALFSSSSFLATLILPKESALPCTPKILSSRYTKQKAKIGTYT
jgi:hypothetical protein